MIFFFFRPKSHLFWTPTKDSFRSLLFFLSLGSLTFTHKCKCLNGSSLCIEKILQSRLFIVWSKLKLKSNSRICYPFSSTPYTVYPVMLLLFFLPRINPLMAWSDLKTFWKTSPEPTWSMWWLGTGARGLVTFRTCIEAAWKEQVAPSWSSHWLYVQVAQKRWIGLEI